MQRKLREQGMRHVYGLGFQVTTNGADPNSTFNIAPMEFLPPRARAGQCLPAWSAVLRTGEVAPHLRFVKNGPESSKIEGWFLQ